jgi:integrase
VRLPRVPRPKLTTWTPEELRRFLESAAGDRLVALYLLLATTGLRRGEAVGLPWSSVNVDAGTLAVRQAMLSIRYRTELGEPKTRHGERVVALDPVTIEVLAAVREQQRGDAVLLGRGWTNTGLVFTRADGSAWHPEYVSRHFEALIQRAGVRKIRLHDLRHTHASMALVRSVAFDATPGSSRRIA